MWASTLVLNNWETPHKAPLTIRRKYLSLTHSHWPPPGNDKKNGHKAGEHRVSSLRWHTSKRGCHWGINTQQIPFSWEAELYAIKKEAANLSAPPPAGRDTSKNTGGKAGNTPLCLCSLAKIHCLWRMGRNKSCLPLAERAENLPNNPPNWYQIDWYQSGATTFEGRTENCFLLKTCQR